MIAETMLGNGGAAFDYYKRTNPSARAAISDVHRCEPYVYAQMIAGRDAASFGEAKNSWLTGSASWHLTAISQWILGVRPELGGLRIDPVLPPTWPGFTARRRWRGATYEIVVHQDTGCDGPCPAACRRRHERRGQPGAPSAGGIHRQSRGDRGVLTAVLLTEPVQFTPVATGAA